MSNKIKMIKPLFVNGNYNREGKRMRSRYVKIVTCDGAEFSLWEKVGAKEKDYARTANDERYIYVLVGEYLVNTGLSAFDFENKVGYIAMVKEMYGSEESRNEYFSKLRDGGDWSKTDTAIKERLREENELSDRHKTNGQIQAEIIKGMIDREVTNWINARDTGGTFASFVGAAYLGEIDQCLKIADILRVERKKQAEIRRVAVAEQRRKEEEERARDEAKEIEAAESIFKNGGKIDSGEMIVKLCDKHGIEIPLRTRGWILNTFAECTILNGRIDGVRYYKKKNGAGSTKIWDILRDLQNVIVNEEWVNELISGVKEGDSVSA